MKAPRFDQIPKLELDSADVNQCINLAEKGNVNAQVELGYRYFFALGLNIEYDFEKAKNYFTKAAYAHHAEGWYGLGLCYYYQDYYPHMDLPGQSYFFHNDSPIKLEDNNFHKAASCFQIAADLGSHRALYDLGMLQLTGKGITKALDIGMANLKKSAEYFSQAQYKLGCLLLNPKETPANPKQAVRYFQSSEARSLESCL